MSTAREPLPDVVVYAAFASFFVLLIIVAVKLSKPKKPAARVAPKSAEKKTFTREDVAKHNTREDCWIILKDKVYDITSYVDDHPGADAILNNAGGDSTEGFHGPQHPERVFHMIDDYLIGDLVETKKDS
uniref:Cytochrome b5 heme-binding domain-containing protein n=1 Tax=Pyramimonas obovata TaxID=1411642 RepID=A0A7S0QX03_9CHLO|mmetsp:Transcript_15791/g.34237  ORF Transcript_15791/g.34237 Transcript_15791/m.34237 type:complete len:130 (+) Transcript_15791:180-569(+)|eukprot:CAMPEP_0118934438 /NCGR_PEP_ID=MMETSP1169-20130426/13826_1 /TAXON_ID=36882 /ORGANISM="Pyramimonas obovata, Strain CCMP722" /LENGTH=129 /DNA_ID=CAMNT_0006877343 /DNA_START=154 /DNA_END=543 /DNA_ORIENTATION=-